MLDAIESSGLTIYRIAKDSGLDFMAVSRFARGERGLNLDSADKPAEYFGLQVANPTGKRARRGGKR